MRSFTDHIICTTYVHKTTWLLSTEYISRDASVIFFIHSFPLSQHGIRSWCYWVSTHLFISLLTAVIPFLKERTNNNKNHPFIRYICTYLWLFTPLLNGFLAKLGCLSCVFTHIFACFSLWPHRSVTISGLLCYWKKLTDDGPVVFDCGGLCCSCPRHSRPTIISGKFCSPAYSHVNSYVTTRT